MNRVVVLCALLGVALARDAQTELKAVVARYDKVKTLQGEFTQSICSEELGYCQDFEGKFALARPNRFRFEVNEPVKQLTVGDSEALWVYFPDSSLAHKSEPMANPFFEILLNSTTDAFLPESLKVEDNLAQLTLFPTDSMAAYSHIKLHFSLKSHSITEIELDDGFGTHLRYTLANVKYNPKLPAKLFRFFPPRGTTVIE